MNKKKLNKKELFFSIMIPVMIVSFLTILFIPKMENYWLEIAIKAGIISVIGLFLGLIIHRYRSKHIPRNDT